MSESCTNDRCEESESNNQLSRREFARRAVAAATAAVIVPGSLLSQETSPKPAASPDKPPQPSTELSADLQAEGELKYQWIIQNYGGRLTEAQKKDVHRLIMEGQKPLAAFRAYPFDNADQPATVLKFTDDEISANRSRA